MERASARGGSGWITFAGVMFLFVGVFNVIAGIAALSLGRGLFLGGFLAFANAIDHLVAVGAYPIWSIIAMTINFLILWGLLTNSDQFVE